MALDHERFEIPESGNGNGHGNGIVTSKAGQKPYRKDFHDAGERIS
jgi:hypothetical protein